MPTEAKIIYAAKTNCYGTMMSFRAVFSNYGTAGITSVSSKEEAIRLIRDSLPGIYMDFCATVTVDGECHCWSMLKLRSQQWKVYHSFQSQFEVKTIVVDADILASSIEENGRSVSANPNRNHSHNLWKLLGIDSLMSRPIVIKWEINKTVGTINDEVLKCISGPVTRSQSTL